MRSKTDGKAVKVKGISTYLKNKSIRRLTRFVITPEGKGFYAHEGELISVEEFYKKFPIVLSRINYKGENKNKKLGWQDGNKSY